MRVRVGVGFEGRPGRGAETAFAIAQKNTDEWRLMIWHGEIEIAIAIEIAEAEIVWLRARREWRTRREGKIPIGLAEKDADRTVVAIANDYVGPAVVIEIGDADEARALAGCENGLPRGF